MASRRSLAFPFGRSADVDTKVHVGELEVKDAATRRAAVGPQYVSSGTAYVDKWDVDRVVRDGYEKVIVVFSAIDKIADKVSGWPIKCVQGVGDDAKDVADEPALELLNVWSNRIDGDAKFFRYRVAAQLLMSKRGVFVEVVSTRGGGIAALNLLPPNRTFPVPDADNWLAGFEVHEPNGDRTTIPEYDPKKRAGVIWIRKPHPTNPYSSQTPLEAAGISIDLDFYARLYNRNFLLNDGRSGQLVAVKGALSDEDARELKARFSPGMGGAGRTTVIEADAVSVNDTAVTPRDAQYAELRTSTQEDLLLALGTPRSVLGAAAGVTFDNADAEKENWLEVTVLSLAQTIESAFTVLSAGGWADGRSFVHDTSAEPVLQRMRQRRIDKAAADYDAGRISLNEYRDVADLPRLDTPGADVVWLAVANRAPISPDEKVMEAASHITFVAPPAAASPAAAVAGSLGAAAGADAAVPLDSAAASDPAVAGPGGASALTGAAQAAADRQVAAAAEAQVQGKELGLLLELKRGLPPELFAAVLEDLAAVGA